MASTVVVTEERITVTEVPADIATIEVSTAGPTGPAGQDFNPWVGVSLDFEDLAAADTTNNIEAFSIPARAVVDTLVIKTAQPFAGGSISAYALSLGLEGELDRYVIDYDAFALASDTNYIVAVVNELLSLTQAKSLKIKAQSTGADLDAATQGRVEIYVKWALLPEVV